jgi:hypothetical protein
MDRVVAESFSILKEDVDSIRALDAIKRHLSDLNAKKQRLLLSIPMGPNIGAFNQLIENIRTSAMTALPVIAGLVDQIERSLHDKFRIQNPYKA